jgi:hypothetical protein
MSIKSNTNSPVPQAAIFQKILTGLLIKLS